MINQRSIFLLDGSGAVVSALCLGVVLPALQQHIGMPRNTLYMLAALAAGFAVYSFSCYRFAHHGKPRWLTGIICLNLGYCALSLFLMLRFASVITPWGFAYFIGEKLIVLGIVALEWRVRDTLS